MTGVDPTEQPGVLGKWEFDAAADADWLWQFELFYAAYQAPLLRYVRSLTVREQLSEVEVDTEAVVNVTMTLAALRWPMLDRPAGWIYTVAATFIRQACRRRRIRWENIAVRPGWTSTHIPARQVPEQLLAIESLLAELPLHQRLAVFLTAAGWSGDEIAEVLGCAPSTVYVHVSRGRSQLRPNEQLCHLVAPNYESIADIASTRHHYFPSCLMVVYPSVPDRHGPVPAHGRRPLRGPHRSRRDVGGGHRSARWYRPGTRRTPPRHAVRRRAWSPPGGPPHRARAPTRRALDHHANPLPGRVRVSNLPAA
jgi:RNA polymerase sigma factor (sigma-70 family)